MTSSNREIGASGRRFEAFDPGQVLDHFVSGFEWTVPTRIELLDFEFLDREPGELAGGEILWYSSSSPLRQVHAGLGLLEDFLKVASASDQAILAYARRWSPLWLCSEHNLPWRHDPGCEPSVSDWTPEDDDQGEVELEDNAGHGRDPIPEAEAWFEEPPIQLESLIRSSARNPSAGASPARRQPRPQG